MLAPLKTDKSGMKKPHDLSFTANLKFYLAELYFLLLVNKGKYCIRTCKIRLYIKYKIELFTDILERLTCINCNIEQFSYKIFGF